MGLHRGLIFGVLVAASAIVLVSATEANAQQPHPQELSIQSKQVDGQKLCGGETCKTPRYSIVGHLVPQGKAGGVVAQANANIDKYDADIQSMEQALADSRRQLRSLMIKVAAQKTMDVANSALLNRKIAAARARNQNLRNEIRNAHLKAGPPGIPGDEGPVGRQGPAGHPGPRGRTGRAGPTGPRGYAGPTGNFGPRGAPGAPGTPGHPGPPGRVGRMGKQGLVGVTGPRGPRGLQGLPGPEGKQGPEGLIGRRGPPGRVGPRGPQGPAGVQGLVGQPGKEGPVGFVGAPGRTGAQGPQGPQGAMGYVGKPGLRGPQGEPGRRGRRGLPGEPGRIGPPGPQGATGDMGRKGVTGPEGRPGLRGFAGTNGKNGAPGKRGRNGDNGKVGAPGRPGPPGVAGKPGRKGRPGVPGKEGARGPRGLPGKRGIAGDNGHPGKPGPRGEEGEQGTKTVITQEVVVGRKKKKSARSHRCVRCLQKEVQPIRIRKSKKEIALVGTVVNYVNNRAVIHAKVTIKKGKDVVKKTATNANGQYVAMLKPGKYTVLVSKLHFQGAPQKIDIKNDGRRSRLLSGLNPRIHNKHAVRAVLTWADPTADLDAHLAMPDDECKVAYYNRVCKSHGHAQLDYDAARGRGPETITLTNYKNGSYSYSVKRYSKKGSIAKSGAVVHVFTHNKVTTFRASKAGKKKANKNGSISDGTWKVFKWVVDDGVGEIRS